MFHVRINNHDADLVILFPVYEVKVKNGVTVYKVRLVEQGCYLILTTSITTSKFVGFI